MDKRKIILYTSDKYNGHAFEVFLEKLYEAFSDLNFEPVYINIDKVVNIQNAIFLMQSNQVLFSIGINDTMLRIYGSDKPTYVYDYLDTVHVSLLQDAPYSVKIGDIYAPARNHLICYLDRSHGDFIRILGLAAEGSTCCFLPMGGCMEPAISEKQVWETEKIYDVVVCAGLWSGNPQRSWHNEADRVTSKILDCIADYMEEYPVNVYEAAKHTFNDLDLDLNIMLPMLEPHLWSLLEYIKTYRRIRAVEYIVSNNVRVDVFGSGWENVSYANKLNLHGQVSYYESVQAIRKSKILFQDQAEFNDGAHDRVFTAMLNSTVVVSEYSKYLDEIFYRNKEIFFYDWKNGIQQVKIIGELLNDNDKRLKVAKNAYKKAVRNHQWINRAEIIVDFVYNKIKSVT